MLALMMNPFVDTSAEGSQFLGKVAKWEMMQAEYRRALRRQAVHRRRPHMQPPQQQPCNASAQHVATPSQQMPPPQNDSYVSVTRPAAAIHEDSANINPPAGKRRKGLMGAVASLGGGAAMATADREDGAIDLEVKLEIERFEAISLKTLPMHGQGQPLRPTGGGKIQSAHLLGRPQGSTAVALLRLFG